MASIVGGPAGTDVPPTDIALGACAGYRRNYHNLKDAAATPRIRIVT